MITGANRPGSSPRRRTGRPARRAGAGRHACRRGSAWCIAFGGEIHAAITVRQIDGTGPTRSVAAAEPLRRIVERRVWLDAMPTGLRRCRSTAAPGPSRGGSWRLGRATTARCSGTRRASADGSCRPLSVRATCRRRLLGRAANGCRARPVVITCRRTVHRCCLDLRVEGPRGTCGRATRFCAPVFGSGGADGAVVLPGRGLDRDGIAAALAPWDAG